MPTRVQFNPSTLKVMRNVATGKVMTVTWDDCEYCDTGKTPRRLQIVFSDVANCSCKAGVGDSVLPVGFAECINGTHILNQSDNACVWINQISCDPVPITRWYWEEEDCTGDWGTLSSCGDIQIYVTREETQIKVWCVCVSSMLTVFYGTTESISNCVEGTVNNATVCWENSAVGGGYSDICSDGSCVITEL